MKSAQTTIYNSVPKVHRPRSTFRMPSKLTTSFNTSFLYPIFCAPVMPGDTFDMTVSNFVRMNPTVTPFMDNIHIEQHWFYVPNRIVWSNFEKFLGAKDNPGDTTTYILPTITSPAVTGWHTASLGAYFGIRQGVSGITTNCLPFRMYNKINNDWFKSEFLTNNSVMNLGDGPDLPTDYPIVQRNTFHDYFTSALPSPQNGSSVMIPSTFTSTASVVSNGSAPIIQLTDSSNNRNMTMSTGSNSLQIDSNAGASGTVRFGAQSGLQANLTADTTGTISALQTAVAIQDYLVRNQNGTRYTEFVYSHFGVVSPDGRLQRSEYLAGNSVPLNMVPVTQNSETATTPQGNLAGMGLMNSHDVRFIKSFTEHGYVIGLVSARSDRFYQQGTPRHWFDSTPYDFYVPALANLPEQAILNREVYTQGTAADLNVFGYIPRWDHLRYLTNQVTGVMNSDATNSMDAWTLAQDYPALPVLNTSFIKDGTPELRVLNVTNEPTFMGQFYFDLKATRTMPIHSIPGMGARL